MTTFRLSSVVIYLPYLEVMLPPLPAWSRAVVRFEKEWGRNNVQPQGLYTGNRVHRKLAQGRWTPCSRRVDLKIPLLTFRGDTPAAAASAAAVPAGRPLAREERRGVTHK